MTKKQKEIEIKISPKEVKILKDHSLSCLLRKKINKEGYFIGGIEWDGSKSSYSVSCNDPGCEFHALISLDLIDKIIKKAKRSKFYD